MSNTHRAVIESSVPPMLNLIAAGPKDFCQSTLTQWIKEHPLGEFETGLVLAVEPEVKVEEGEELTVYGYTVVGRDGEIIHDFKGSTQQEAIDFATIYTKNCVAANIDWDYRVAAIVDQGGL